MVSAAFHQQYRERERQTERATEEERKKKRRDRERGEPGETVTVCVSVFVSVGTFEPNSEVMSSRNTTKCQVSSGEDEMDAER